MNQGGYKAKREQNLDLLRILCTLAVIMIHVGGAYKIAFFEHRAMGVTTEEHFVAVVLYNVLPRFAVPCFFMLSGAFLLADERNAEYRWFYCKSFCKIGVPTIIFSLLYFTANEAVNILRFAAAPPPPITVLADPIYELVVGVPFYHMWYLYALVWVYLVTPLMIRFKRDIGEAAFGKVCWVMLFMACICGFTSQFMLYWGIGKSSTYLGYFMIGYQLKKVFTKKNSKKGLAFIALGMGLLVLLAAVMYSIWIKGQKTAPGPFNIGENHDPFVAGASILIFVGFCMLDGRQWNLQAMTKATFYIYLLHAGVWYAVSMWVERYLYAWDCRIVIPIMVCVVFVCSWGLAKVYMEIWPGIDKKCKITNRMCSALRLQ